MKTTEQIQALFDKYWAKTFYGLTTDETIRYKDIGRQDQKQGYVAGYHQAQQDMIEDGAKDFDEWLGDARNNFADALAYEYETHLAKQAFTAGRLSGLKERASQALKSIGEIE